MKIRKISIENFRGIKTLEWTLPDQNFFCLIGKGDSGKTAILEAIRYVFHPQWNFVLNDADFYLCEIDNPIRIEIIIGELSDEFCSDKKYGMHLQGWDKTSRTLHDEPGDEDEKVLSACLTVAKDLESKWKIVTSRNPEGVDFKASDRDKVNVGLIGSYSEKQLTWAAGTPLAKLTESKNLGESLIEVSRVARSSLEEKRKDNLTSFDAAAAKSQEVATRLGISVNDSFKAHLDRSALSLKQGGLSLHDGEVPLRQLGLGSRRMLACGIQQETLDKQHITLFDEIELGLEPHRITQLITHLKENKFGQYFLTTHSPTVLRELRVEQLYVVHKLGEETKIVPTAGKSLEGLNIQGHMRSSAEAFLSLKVIVCEGATEVGFLRGLDSFWMQAHSYSMAYKGTALIDAHSGSKVKSLAKGFDALEYKVCVVVDNDSDDFSPADAEALREKSIHVCMWSDKLSLEEQAMLDLPWASVLESVILAESLTNSARQKVMSKLNGSQPSEISEWVDSLELRKAIGAAAKEKPGWFKSISKGQSWFEAIEPAFKDPDFKKKDFAIKLEDLHKWIQGE